VQFIEGDANAEVDRIRALVPSDWLAFCFADPYGVNIRLDTLRRLSAGRRMDVMVLLALQMDANRNRDLYARDDSQKLEDFLGNRAWRTEWDRARREGKDFRVFLAEQYHAAMKSIGYAPKEFDQMYQMKTETNRSIYYLAFFSKHELGYKFWKEAMKYSDEQIPLL
jgi:three-Cys-motif partner protein